MIWFFTTFLYNPILNALIFLYNTVAFHDFGIAIILLTLLIRLVLFPVFHKSVKHQMVMQHIQPKMKKLQEEHKHDKQKQAEAMMALYKEYEINPFSGFLFLLIQLPILWALYRVFLQIYAANAFAGLYSWVATPTVLNEWFLGLINLKSQSIVIVLLAAAAQFLQVKIGAPKLEGKAKTQANVMAFIAPLVTIFIFLKFNLPSAVALYWLVTTAFSIGQQYFINKKLKNQNGELGIIRKKSN